MYEEQISSAYYLDRVTSDALREGEWNLITCVFESFAGDGDPNTRDDIRLSIYVNGEPAPPEPRLHPQPQQPVLFGTGDRLLPVHAGLP